MVNRCGKLRPGEICIFAISPTDTAVCPNHHADWMEKFQTAVYRVGEYLLNLPLGRSRRVKKTVRIKFEIKMGSTRRGGAFGIRFAMGESQLALSDISVLQTKALHLIQELLEGTRKDFGIHQEKIEHAVKLLRPDGKKIERVGALWNGGGFLLSQGLCKAV